MPRSTSSRHHRRQYLVFASYNAPLTGKESHHQYRVQATSPEAAESVIRKRFHERGLHYYHIGKAREEYTAEERKADKEAFDRWMDRFPPPKRRVS